MVPLQLTVHALIVTQAAKLANKLDLALHAKLDTSTDLNVPILALMAPSPQKTRNYVWLAIRLAVNALLETFHLARAAMMDTYLLIPNVFQDALTANI